MKKLSEARKYAIAGVLFGICFPVGSVAFFLASGELTLSRGLSAFLIDAHLNGLPGLLFIIDTAPIFLGLLAYLAGARQDRILRLTRGLEDQVAEKTESLRRALADAQKANEMISHLADHDPLTGLLNRRSLQKELDRWTAHTKRYKRVLALIFIDVDKFKTINDRLGHHAGDEYIVALSRILTKALRNTDYLSRWGGDEFAVLLPETDVAAASEVAAKILRSFNEAPIRVAGHDIQAAASLGIAVMPFHAETADELMAFADVAMYEAKAAGGNTWRIYSASPEQLRRAQEQAQWEMRIRRALEADQFVLFYQPLLRLADRQTRNYEALLRMEDREGALIGPHQFLRPAERYGLAVPIDRMVIRKAAHRVASLPSGTSLSLNLSAQTLADAHLPAYIEEVITRSGIRAARLGFEIAEQVLVENLAPVRSIAAELNRMGCPLIVDDFGPGFTSLRYLQELQVKTIKLEAGLLRDLDKDEAAHRLLRTLVAMAHDLDIAVTAKFVEDPGLLPLLTEIGVDYAQGFAVGRPIESLDVAISA